MEFSKKAQRLYRTWTLKILNEWSRSGVPNEEPASPFHLALLYMFDLHGALQESLQEPASAKNSTRLATCLSLLHNSPAVTELPGILAIYRSRLSRLHRQPVRIARQHQLSYSEAVESHRQELIRLFSSSITAVAVEGGLEPDGDLVENGAHFRSSCVESPGEAEQVAGVVVNNNASFSRFDVGAYESWLKSNRCWDFRTRHEEAVPEPTGTPLTLKQLEKELDLRDTTLLIYRDRAGLTIGARGKRSPPLTASEIVRLCQSVLDTCPTADTRARAARLKARYLPDSQIFRASHAGA